MFNLEEEIQAILDVPDQKDAAIANAYNIFMEDRRKELKRLADEVRYQKLFGGRNGKE